MHLLFIALGGSLGALGRYYISQLLAPMSSSTGFPVGTLLANVIGSALMGLCFVLIVEKSGIHPQWRHILMVGFLGAFTTFSSFALESIVLFEAGKLFLALTYTLLSLTLCMLTCFGAIILARVLLN